MNKGNLAIKEELDNIAIEDTIIDITQSEQIENIINEDKNIKKPNIIYTIPSISSKLNALNSFGLEKYDIVCMIPTTSKKHPRQINNTDNETSGLNIKKSETTIRQIDNTIDPFAYLFI